MQSKSKIIVALLAFVVGTIISGFTVYELMLSLQKTKTSELKDSINTQSKIKDIKKSGGKETSLGDTTIYFNSANVSYNNSNSGLTLTKVQNAIDELYEITNAWINPSYVDFTTLATNTNKTILASSAGICIKRNNKVACMKK